ncbi:MAG: hypothetical protein Q7T10_01230 [Rhodoferax sp.]|uniref:hypothetical protein n=1 Tax=Rhodoferax sp. TaxID=50421 RepID=UPI002716C2F4|nr:hypothetical protein [Rhodoferax sp.]MDO8447413.1 hypothetical protein [Rhodoferax sp.]
MEKVLVALVSIALTATVCIAAETHGDKETKADVARHRAMAAAHEAAAKCLESGKKEDVCNKELQIACKGLAIGKFCGMKHEH